MVDVVFPRAVGGTGAEGPQGPAGPEGPMGPGATDDQILDVISPLLAPKADTVDVDAAIAGRQPLDADLTAIAALTTDAFGRSLLTMVDGAALRTTAGLVIGTDVQAYDADLSAIAALSGTNTIYYRSGAGVWSAVTVGSGLTFSSGTLAATGGGGGGGGDVTGPATNTDNYVPQWDGADTKTLKNGRAIGVAGSTDLIDRAAGDGRYQPLDSDLTAIAALTTTSYGRALLTAATGADIKPIESIIVAISDETTTITTGTAKVTMRMPYAFTLTAVRSSVNTVSSSGLVTVDINEGGATILSTKLSIDASEKTSTTAATPVVISDASLADDAEITFDIDAAGTGAKGLKVVLIGYRT